MKLALKGLGTVLMFFGLVWLLQGIGVLPGSFMSGQLQWAVYGGLSFAAGALMFAASRRGSGPRR